MKLEINKSAVVLVGVVYAATGGSLRLTAGVLGSCLAHELGHIVQARQFRVKVKALGVNWKGFYNRRGRNSWYDPAIALAGPLVNITLAPLCWIVHSRFLFVFNLALAVVNLIPWPKGTDGHRFLESI